MTNYSPLYAARDEVGDTVTVADMIDAGYDDFDVPDEPTLVDIQSHLAGALAELDGQIFDDTAKWNAVNEIVAAMLAVDRLARVTTTVEISTEAVTEQPEWADEPITYDADTLGVRVE